jgi:hypothetical protein
VQPGLSFLLRSGPPPSLVHASSPAHHGLLAACLPLRLLVCNCNHSSDLSSTALPDSKSPKSQHPSPDPRGVGVPRPLVPVSVSKASHTSAPPPRATAPSPDSRGDHHCRLPFLLRPAPPPPFPARPTAIVRPRNGVTRRRSGKLRPDFQLSPRTSSPGAEQLNRTPQNRPLSNGSPQSVHIVADRLVDSRALRSLWGVLT